jgi:3',5'-cyclic AMP phosphodiesterase CpdA
MLICQLTDLHIRPVGRTSNRVVDTNMLTQRALRAVARLRPAPDLVVITGDLTECGLAEEYAHLAALLQRFLTMPVYVIPGNHDRRDAMREGLGHLPSVTADPHYVQYAVDQFPVRLVMLDTLVPGAGHGELRPEQLAFLDQTLAAAPDHPTIIGMHHPPFLCGIAHLDRISLRDASAFAGIVARHRQVERIICGHHHRAIVGRVAHAVASISPSVVHQMELTLDPNDRGSFVLEPPAYQLHRWSPSDGLASHTAYVEEFPGPYPFVKDPG